MSIYEAVIDLVGAVPSGFDIVVWIFSALFLFYLIKSVFSIIYAVLGWMGGQR